MDKLKRWMQVTGHSNSSLAQAIGFSYEYIYKITSGERPISEGFKWRFVQTFGWNAAQSVFEPEPAMTHLLLDAQ